MALLPHANGSRTLLLVDDDALLCEVLARAFASRGFAPSSRTGGSLLSCVNWEGSTW